MAKLQGAPRLRSTPQQALFSLLSFAASRLRERFLPRGSGRGEPDQGIDPVAGVLWVILKLVKIFFLHPPSAIDVLYLDGHNLPVLHLTHAASSHQFC